jgi:hypothetical protein
MTSRNTLRSASLMAVASAMAEAPARRKAQGVVCDADPGADRSAPRAPAERAPKGGTARIVAARTELAKGSPKRGASAKQADLKRIAELKCKLRDEDYMNGAILRIATVLSARLTLR